MTDLTGQLIKREKLRKREIKNLKQNSTILGNCTLNGGFVLRFTCHVITTYMDISLLQNVVQRLEEVERINSEIRVTNR